MKKLVVLSGAGISQESGLKTFRDGDGLWRTHSVYTLASPEGWAQDPATVLEFYNERRRQVIAAQPNPAHLALARLEQRFEVTIITQNVDDLHERAGSSRVIHLHGEILKARSSLDESLVYDTQGRDIQLGDQCERGSQLRPHVVWFGEMILGFPEAVAATSEADIFLVVGTSLSVFPAASLIHEAPSHAEKIVVAPELDQPPGGFRWIQEKAGTALSRLAEEWLA